MSILFRKIDNLFFLFLLINVLVYIGYYRVYYNVLQAEELWQEQNLYTKRLSYQVGNIILVNFKEVFLIRQEIQENKNKNIVIKLVPDSRLFPYLPSSDDTRSSQKSVENRNQNRLELKFKMAVKVIRIDTKKNTIVLEGTRQFHYNQNHYILYFRGETNPAFIENDQIPSELLTDVVLQIRIQEKSDQNLKIQENKLEITEESKQKIFLEYLKQILKEQNIHVP